MMYMDADNDLELDQMEDLKEMIAAGSSKDVNIVVLADRHPPATNGSLRTSRLLIEKLTTAKAALCGSQ
jgi:hypothetical protein